MYILGIAGNVFETIKRRGQSNGLLQTVIGLTAKNKKGFY